MKKLFKRAARAKPKAAKKSASKPKSVKKRTLKPKASKKPTRRAKVAKKSSSRAEKLKKQAAPNKDWWELRLYVAGQTPLGVQAFDNLKRICEEHLQGRYRIEVVDLLVNPTLGRGDQILAVPTLVRQLPPPMKKIIGDFSNSEKVLVGLNLRPLNRQAMD